MNQPKKIFLRVTFEPLRRKKLKRRREIFDSDVLADRQSISRILLLAIIYLARTLPPES